MPDTRIEWIPSARQRRRKTSFSCVVPDVGVLTIRPSIKTIDFHLLVGTEKVGEWDNLAAAMDGAEEWVRQKQKMPAA